MLSKSLLHRFIEKPSSSSQSHPSTLPNHNFLLTMDLKLISPDSDLISTVTHDQASNPHILNLFHQLYTLEQRDMPTTAYLHLAKNLADQLAIAGRPITLSEFNILALRGLRPEFKDIVVTLAARPGPLSFPELHSFLLSHEFIHDHTFYHGFCTKPANNFQSPDCQLCSGAGHTAKSCGLLKYDRCHETFELSSLQKGEGYAFSSREDDKHKNIGVGMRHSKVKELEDDCCGSFLKDENYSSMRRVMKDDDQNNSMVIKKDIDNSSIHRDDFPQEFVFGVATSSYQFEGAAAQGGRGLGVWDIFSMETPDRIFDGTNGNVAVDMYNRYKEDIAMMKKMGFEACRISISWPRILPGGRRTAGINKEGIDFYNDFINTLLAHDIEPYVSLFHWDLPYCLEQEYGGFLSKQVVNDFREFVELCFWEFGDRVKSWITVNEPWTYCTSGYVSGKFPPSKPAASADQIGNNLTTYRAIHDPKLSVPANHSYFNSKTESDPAKDAYTVARNLLLAHATAVHSYRTKFKELQEGKIGMVLCCQWFEPLHENSEEDVAASKRGMDFMLGWFLEPALYGRYPESMIKFVPPENLAPFTEEESQMLKGSIDFLGLNYYTANYAANDIYPNTDKAYYRDQKITFVGEKDGKLIGPLAGSTWLYIVPWGIYKLLKHIKDTYKDLPPIYITENGVDDMYDCKLSGFDVCADKTRVKYHQDHLAYILKAMNENVNVKGYFVWSYCDNFEWYEGFTVRFGLVYIDFMNNLTRYPKSSAFWFTKFLRKGKAINKARDKMLSSETSKFIED